MQCYGMYYALPSNPHTYRSNQANHNSAALPPFLNLAFTNAPPTPHNISNITKNITITLVPVDSIDLDDEQGLVD
ncbi:hypothetical protein P8452_37687 [Trifolium repens]|nr:hypothetical protein P8452_37687 [Trifolium repens]